MLSDQNLLNVGNVLDESRILDFNHSLKAVHVEYEALIHELPERDGAGE